MENIKEKFIEYLENNGIKFRDSGGKVQHQCLNPDHEESNPSAYSNFSNTDEIFSHCSSCGYHLNHTQIVALLGGTIDDSLQFKAKMDKLFKEFIAKESLLNSQKEDIQVILPPKLKDFQAKYRGISSKTFNLIGAYITPDSNYYKSRIIVPLYDYKNKLKGFDAISFSKETTPKVLRSKNCNTKTFFGFENLLFSTEFKRNNILFICEGFFSALSFLELNYKAVYNFGVSEISSKLEVLYQNGIKTIIFVGDNDQAGRSFNTEMYHLLKKSFKCVYFKFPYNTPEKYDSNDLLKKGLLQEAIDKTLKQIPELNHQTEE